MGWMDWFWAFLTGVIVGGSVTGWAVWMVARGPWNRLVAAVPYLWLADPRQREARVLRDVASAEAIWAVARSAGLPEGADVALSVSMPFGKDKTLGVLVRHPEGTAGYTPKVKG